MMPLLRAHNSAARFLFVLLCFVAGYGNYGCRQTPSDATGTTANENRSAASAVPTDGGGGTPLDTVKLDAEIARLEKEVEKSPGDETARTALAKIYLRRAAAYQRARQPQAALADYRRALRLDPDNEEAPPKIAALKKELGEDDAADDGDPAGLPLSPEALDDNAAENSSAPPRPPKKGEAKKNN